MDKNIIKTVYRLNRIVQEYSSQYFHSKILASSSTKIIFNSEIHSFDIHYSLKDLLLIGAITESPILLTGGTDLGKTTFAKMVMNALFGEEEKGWHKLDFDLDFGKDSYTNVNSDFFHESGKDLSDLYSIHKWMQFPGFIADELNGVHPKIARKALHIIKEKDITLPDGRRVRIGYPLENNETYQFQIATINEGSEYTGIFDMDKALRRRTTIEIPMDVFRPTPFDRLSLQKSKKEQILNTQNHLQEILEIKKVIDTIKLHPIAEMFISYLEAFDFCKNSLTGEKGSIISRNGSIEHVCTAAIRVGNTSLDSGIACEFLRTFEYNLCPNVCGITPGISENLILVSKGFALLRAMKFVEMIAVFFNNEFASYSFSLPNPERFVSSLQKYVKKELTGRELGTIAALKYINELEVEQSDIQSAIGFVGYSKIGMNQMWVNKHFQGNKFEAVKFFIDQASLKFKEGVGRAEFDEIINKTSNEQSIKQYCFSSNPWLWRVVVPYFKEQNLESCPDSFDLYV